MLSPMQSRHCAPAADGKAIFQAIMQMPSIEKTTYLGLKLIIFKFDFFFTNIFPYPPSTYP